MDKVIVSRHPAAIAFIARALGGHLETLTHLIPAEKWVRVYRDGSNDPIMPRTVVMDSIPVIAEATLEDVRGKIVYGNIPLHLACAAEAVVAVEFAGPPPRGQEYDLAAMDAAGARLCGYAVLRLDRPEAGKSAYLQSGGFCI